MIKPDALHEQVQALQKLEHTVHHLTSENLQRSATYSYKPSYKQVDHTDGVLYYPHEKPPAELHVILSTR